jgi:hypothetical protein
VLTAYFDETNTSPNQKVPLVAGYIASTFQWSRFSEQWNKLLRQWTVPVDSRYGIRLVHRNKLQHLQGDFAAWGTTDRDEFLQNAYAIILRNTRAPIGGAVNRQDFERFALKPLQRVMAGPYGWCAYTCLHLVNQYCQTYGIKGNVRFVFEMGAPGWGQVKRLFDYLEAHGQFRDYYPIHSISFVTKSTRQLQAADFLAYDLGRFFLDRELGRTRSSVNEYLRNLLGPRPETNFVRLWDEKTLTNHAKMLDEAGLFQS